MKYNFTNIGNRIRDLRKSKKYSQDAFIEKLSEHGLKISRNTLSSIENGVESAYTFAFLKTISEIYNCDIGYILGEYEEKTQEIHQICANTGLSEKATNVIMQYHKENDFSWEMDLFNSMVENQNFLLFMYNLRFFVTECFEVDAGIYKLTTKDIAFVKIQDNISMLAKDLELTFSKRIKEQGDTRIYFSLLRQMYIDNKISDEKYQEALQEFRKGNFDY